MRTIFLLSILGFFIVGGLLIYNIIPENVEEPEPESELGYQTIGVYKVGTASTSPVYLEPTDSTSTDSYVTSTSKTFRTDNVSEIDMNLAVTASTSAVLSWVYYLSDNGIDWYAEDGNTDTSDTAMTHGASAYTHNWTPGVTTTVYKRVNVIDSLESLNSKYFMVYFTSGTASSTLYAEIITKEN